MRAAPEDERAIDALLDAFFAAVSYEPGQTPPYERLLELFRPDGTLLRAGVEDVRSVPVAQFVADRQEALRTGRTTRFAESEQAARTDVFGDVAHRLSTYVKTGVLDGEAFSTRGVISTQLVRAGAGWRVLSMAWDDERPGLSLDADPG